MNNLEKIRIAIVDDNKECIDSLIENLSFYHELEVCCIATRYKQALDLLLKEGPDLVFLDIEMPVKNGFELLNEAREKGATFSVIFYTAYDKYTTQALREQALDYILKPIDPEELKNAIDRFKALTKTQIPANPSISSLDGSADKIALPTYLGLQFVEKNHILLFRSVSGRLMGKPCWEALLTNSTEIKLNNHITAEKITQFLPAAGFFQINQSCIINLTFLSGIIYKTRDCHLIPPYDKIKLSVSRPQLSKLKENFDVL